MFFVAHAMNIKEEEGEGKWRGATNSNGNNKDFSFVFFSLMVMYVSEENWKNIMYVFNTLEGICFDSFSISLNNLQ